MTLIATQARWNKRTCISPLSAPPASSDESMRTVVITPTYNERDNLAPFVTAVLSVDPTLDIVIVDDNSPDGTADLASILAAETGRLHVVRRPAKLGLGTAYLAGIRYALARRYDYIVLMDADLSHRPADLPSLLSAARRADLAIGSRTIAGGRVEQWPLARQCLSKGGNLYARTLLRLPVRDCTSGFVCLRADTARTIDLDKMATNGFGFHIELKYLCHRAGLRLVETPIVFPDRSRGRSKLSPTIALEAFGLVWRLWYRTTVAAPAMRLSGILVQRRMTARGQSVIVQQESSSPNNTNAPQHEPSADAT